MDAVDRDLAIRTVLAEASGQGPEGMAAVAHVIRNRSAVGRYGGKSVGEVVTAKNQFEPWNDVGAGKPNDPMGYAPTDPGYQRAAKIVDAVFSGALPDPTRGATHFYAPKAQADLGRKSPSWAAGQKGLKIGDHMFYAPDGTVSDLSQGMGEISQDPNAATPKLDPAANMPGAPKMPSLGGAAGGAAGGNMSTTDLLRMFMGQMGKPAASTPSHGALNQLFFGPQGWQGKVGQALPNGLLGALFGGGAGGGGGGGAAPAAAAPGPGAPMQLGPAGGAPPAPSPMPSPGPTMTAAGTPAPIMPEGPPMLAGMGAGAGGAGAPMSLGGGGGGNPLSLLASMFGLG